MSEIPKHNPDTGKEAVTQVVAQSKEQLQNLQKKIEDPIVGLRGFLESIKSANPEWKGIIEFFEKIMGADDPDESPDKRSEKVHQAFGKNIEKLVPKDIEGMIAQKKILTLLNPRYDADNICSQGRYEFFLSEIATKNPDLYGHIKNEVSPLDVFPEQVKVISVRGVEFQRTEKGYVSNGQILKMDVLEQFEITVVEEEKKDVTSEGSEYGGEIDPTALHFIKNQEGFSAKPFWDYQQYSIGFGSKYEGPTDQATLNSYRITKQQGEKLLVDQIKTSYLPVLARTIPNWNKMSKKMQGALLSFGYNLGANFYTNQEGFSTINAALRSEATWKDVPAAMELYCKAGGKTLAGLVRRRKQEGELWNQGLQERAA